MDILGLIDRLEDIIANGRKVPLSGSVVLQEQRMYEIIDELRAALPEELKTARWIVKERQEMIDEADKEAERVIDEARLRAEEMLKEKEIVRLAERRANDIIEAAQAREREIRLGAEDYADEMLANLEVNLGKLLTAVQRGRDRLQGRLER
ncbi:MAG: ATPase [Actinomycetota bacterium]|uniref:ATPase n=1 Tax=Candidatus Aquicultor primus TaxID=1797195 RepID=A0A1F2UHC6_9ACTN|nr:ATPase [Actinomycetota bacterium]OFW32447.1 MAG: ATPase [Candidatus Aquicultor primus]